MYENLLTDKTAADLRKLGAQYGIAGASKGKKADLIVKIAAAMEADRLDREAKANPASVDLNVSEHPTTDPEANAKITAEEAAVSEAPAETLTETSTAASAKPACKNVCRSCSTRSIGTGSGDSNDRDTAKAVELCVPCHEEAQWENEHSDRGHDSLPADSEERAGCWICRPELNRASAEYVGRAGTSRAGMTINVPLRADGKTKAATVAEKLAAMKIDAKIKRAKGQEILTAEVGGTPLNLVWDSRGRYVYAESTFNSRKVRNVSEALRLAARKVDAGQ